MWYLREKEQMYLSFHRVGLALVLLTAWFGTSDALGSHSSTPSPVIAAKAKAIPDRYIVVLKEGSSARSVAAVAGVQPSHLYTASLNGFAAELNAGQVNALRHNPNVAYLEQDQEVTLDAMEHLLFGEPWGIDRIDQRELPLSQTYRYTSTGKGVAAYVIDTGLQANHVRFDTRAANVYDALGGTGNDCNGHGTHVAGIITSVAKHVNLRGVRVLDCNGSGSWSGVIAGVEYVRLNAQKPAVANMSFSGAYSAAANTAVANLANSGVFVAVGASNDSGQDACNRSPASTPEAYTVAASDKTDTRATFTNTGPCVDIYAPGVGITSAWINSSSKTLSGTSMAAPHVTGVAVLYKNAYGDAPSATIGNWLSSTATPNVIKNNPAGTPNRLLYSPGCPESSCLLIQNTSTSHFTGVDCTGEEYYHTAQFNNDGIRRSWDGQGFAGATLRTVANKSWKDSSGVCHNDWPNGNTLSGLVRIYRDTLTTPVQAAYISHFTELNCTGQESYYTLYFSTMPSFGPTDGILRSWDGRGTAGTILYQATNKSAKDSNGVCHNNWPNGNTLNYFVRIYR
jgi:subtilisin family serine protease